MPTTDPFIVATRPITRPVAEYWAEVGGMHPDTSMHVIEQALLALVAAGAIPAGDGLPSTVVAG